ncbi:MAG: hypothetical protein Q9162_004913 [Coniocarpon cinnabarinum]
MNPAQTNARSGLSVAFLTHAFLFLLLFLCLSTLLLRNYKLPHENIGALRQGLSTTLSSSTAPAGPDDARPASGDASTPADDPHGFVWSDVTRLLTFGDSLSDAAFDPKLEQPSAANPFGNPPFPKKRFLGPNWADFLTIAHNRSLVLNYNFAKGGATIDNRIVGSPYGSPSFSDQINTFTKLYAERLTNGDWSPLNTLAIIRFGVNDCVGPYIRHQTLNLTEDVRRYSQLVERLYGSGVRSFLFLNVGTVDRNFMVLNGNPARLPQLTADVAKWNQELHWLRANLTDRHLDVNAWVFDVYEFFLWLEQHSKEVEATQHLSNTTGICRAYAAPNHDPFIPAGKETWFMDEKECSAPLDQYFWVSDW